MSARKPQQLKPPPSVSGDTPRLQSGFAGSSPKRTRSVRNFAPPAAGLSFFEGGEAEELDVHDQLTIEKRR